MAIAIIIASRNIGQTNNLEKRLKEHQDNNSKSTKYIKYFSSYSLVYSETYPSRSEAMKREWQLKKWTRKKRSVNKWRFKTP